MANTNKVGFLQRVVSAVTSKLRKSDTDYSLESLNPLFNITTARAQMIFDMARRGNYAQLQFIYNEIERTDPTLLVCVTRRASALSELDWKIVRSDERRNRYIDQKLVDEQIECLETAIANIDNFVEAVEHLALAPFRGFSHVNPRYTAGGKIKHLDLLDNWNLCWDRMNRVWLWNPDATSWKDPRMKNGAYDKDGLDAIPPSELVSVIEKRAIDWPALKIFLRTSLGERDWGRFLETYGLPPVIITMPDLTNKDDQQAYVDAAQSIFEGRSGVVPFGSEVNYAESSRGTNPFTEFIEHQQKLTVLMATGGTLTSLAESGSGTLAGGAQMDVWHQIVRRDTRITASAINNQLCSRILNEAFPGKAHLAEFKFETEPDPTPRDVLELAQMANGAGLQMDVKEINEMTGYTFTIQNQDGGMGGMGVEPTIHEQADQPSGGDDGTNGNASETAKETQGEESPNEEIDGKTEGMETRLTQNSVVTNAEPEDKDAKPEPKKSSAAQRLAWSLQTDFKSVADRLNEIIALPEDERADAARKLMQEIDDLVPNDPAMAAVIAEQMAEAFAGQANKDKEEVK